MADNQTVERLLGALRKCQEELKKLSFSDSGIAQALEQASRAMAYAEDRKDAPMASEKVHSAAEWWEYSRESGGKRFVQDFCEDVKGFVVRPLIYADLAATPQVPEGYIPVRVKITEEMHVAAVKVLRRANGIDDLPQRMLDAMLSADTTTELTVVAEPATATADHTRT